MTLHDAIYYPRVEYHVTKHRQNPIQDDLRRMQTLKENNIQILTFEEIEHLEQQLLTLNQKEEMANKYNFKPKPSLRIRFISFFKGDFSSLLKMHEVLCIFEPFVYSNFLQEFLYDLTLLLLLFDFLE